LVSRSVGTDEGSLGSLNGQLDLDWLLREHLINHLFRDAKTPAVSRVAVLVVPGVAIDPLVLA
jgi:hypothetical protein